MAPLPPKQNGVFKKILKCYDYKQYKMGLKLAKQILLNPETSNHGETLAMKGLIMNCMGKKEEAYEYVRKGLRNDLTSHVCWHVYGLLQRSEHKYDEAIKCFRNALKYDKDNITILRDLGLLQIQMRDLEGFRDTRYLLFMLRSAQRVSWLSYAVAYHLLEDYSTAIKILDEFRRTQKKDSSSQPLGDNEKAKNPDPIDYEQSELLLYQITIFSEAQNYKEGLDFLNKHASQICDRLAVLEFRVEFLFGLGRNLEALKTVQDNLIVRNPDNYKYYEYLEKALDPDLKDEANRLILYKNIQKKYPRSQVPFKIPLSFVNTPETFKVLVDEYLRKFIRKCLPALFRNLRPVYNKDYAGMVSKLDLNDLRGSVSSNLENGSQQENTSPSTTKQNNESKNFYIESSNKSQEERRNRLLVFTKHRIPPKIEIIEQLMLSYDKNLQENVSFDADPGTKNSENKTIILWVYYYLAQHYDYLGMYDKALEYVKIAMEHTPTLIELLTLKGKIYKHMGEVDKAVEHVNEAQRLDTADRYLNAKCVKYLLRANKIPQAEEMCSKFIRAGVSVIENLNEMQCIWFKIETARAYHRMKMFGMSLKICYEIDAFFSEVIEEQFDFHTYCMRKMTLRSYIKLLRMEDVLRSHRFYFDAADIAINIYLNLHDDPSACDGKENRNTNNKNDLNLSVSELKKIKSKERKAAAKQLQNQKHGNNKSQQGAANGKHKNKNNCSEKQDGNKSKQVQSVDEITTGATGLEPHELEHPKDPLEKAIRFLRPLMTFAKERINTHLLAFEVYKRKNKILLMLQSVKRAQKLDQFHPKFKHQLAQFLKIATPLTIDTEDQQHKVSEPVKKVLELELSELKSVYSNAKLNMS